MIAQMSGQYAPACTIGKNIITLKMALNLNLMVSTRAHAQLSYIYTLARPTWNKQLVNSCIYIEIPLRYKSIRVDERDLSRMV